jgi:hypothetical protein
MLGEPRMHCPYCRRKLPSEACPEPLLAEIIPTAAPMPSAVPNSAEQASTLADLIRRKDALRGEVQHQTESRFWQIAPDAPAVEVAPPGAPATSGERVHQRRFLDSAQVGIGLREVRDLAERELAKRTRQACQGCELATCDLAFTCGALPRERHGAVYVLGWTAGQALIATALTALAVLPIWYLVTLGTDPSYLALALWLLSVPLAVGAATFSYTLCASRWRRAHWRALATAAKELGLQFCQLKLAARTSSLALPVLSPGASAATRPMANDELDTQVVLAGEYAGQEILVVKHEFRFAVAEHMPSGVFRHTPLLLRPQLLLSQSWKRAMWRGYLLALFPDPLPGVPDFALGSVRDPEGAFLQHHFRGQIASVPSRLGNQPAVFAAADAAAPPLPHALHDLLGTLVPGWSIEVSAGRLIVWRDTYWPTAPWTWPQSAPAVVELLHVANRVRRILVDSG